MNLEAKENQVVFICQSGNITYITVLFRAIISPTTAAACLRDRMVTVQCEASGRIISTSCLFLFFQNKGSNDKPLVVY